jgi:Flp pilus assembly protein TadG
MNGRLGCGRKSEQGNATAEFALISVMFIMLLLGVIEMGRMILVYTTIAHAAKYGERYAIVHGYFRTGSTDTTNTGPTATDIRTQVQNFSGIAPLTPGNVNVAVNYPGLSGETYCSGATGELANATGCPVQVNVTYPFTPLLGYFNAMLSVNLSSTSEGVITY